MKKQWALTLGTLYWDGFRFQSDESKAKWYDKCYFATRLALYLHAEGYGAHVPVLIARYK